MRRFRQQMAPLLGRSRPHDSRPLLPESAQIGYAPGALPRRWATPLRCFWLPMYSTWRGDYACMLGHCCSEMLHPLPNALTGNALLYIPGSRACASLVFGLPRRCLRGIFTVQTRVLRPPLSNFAKRCQDGAPSKARSRILIAVLRRSAD